MKRRREDKPDARPPGVAAAEGSSAKLKAGDGTDLPVQISSRDGDVLMLVLLAKSDDVDLGTDQRTAGAPLMLECTSDHGVVSPESTAGTRKNVAGRPRSRSTGTASVRLSR